MRETSLQAWESMRDSKLLPEARLRMLLGVIYGEPCTAREAVKAYEDKHGERTLSGGWKRISELERLGVIEEVERRPCSITGRRAIVWRVTGRLPEKKAGKGPKKRSQNPADPRLPEHVTHGPAPIDPSEAGRALRAARDSKKPESGEQGSLFDPGVPDDDPAAVGRYPDGRRKPRDQR